MASWQHHVLNDTDLAQSELPSQSAAHDALTARATRGILATVDQTNNNVRCRLLNV